MTILLFEVYSMRDYAKKRSWADFVAVQDVESGATTRPQRQKLIEVARRREIDRVLVWQLDRWRWSALRMLGLEWRKRR